MPRAAGVEVRINRQVPYMTSLRKDVSDVEGREGSGEEDEVDDTESVQQVWVQHLGSDLSDHNSEVAADGEALGKISSQDSVSKQLLSEMGVSKSADNHADHVEPAKPAPEAPSGHGLDDHATAPESASLLNTLRSRHKHPATAPASARLTMPAKGIPQRSPSPAPTEDTGGALSLKAVMLQKPSLASLPKSSRTGTLRRSKYIFDNMTKGARARTAAERADPYAIADSPVKDIPSRPQLDEAQVQELSRPGAQKKRKADHEVRHNEGHGSPSKRARRDAGVAVALNRPHANRLVAQEGKAERGGERITRSTVSKEVEEPQEDVPIRRAHKVRDDARPNTIKKTEQGQAAKEKSVPRAAHPVVKPKSHADSIDNTAKVDSRNLRLAKNNDGPEGHEQPKKRGRPLGSKTKKNRPAVGTRDKERPNDPREHRSSHMEPPAARASASAENAPEASLPVIDGAREPSQHPTTRPEAPPDSQESDHGDALEACSNVRETSFSLEVSANRGTAKSSANDVQASSKIASAGSTAGEKRANIQRSTTTRASPETTHGHTENEDEDETQLHGQKARLQDIYSASRKIGRHKVRAHTVVNKPKLQTEAVKKLKNLCSETRKLYVIMLDIDNDEELSLAKEKSEDLLECIENSIASIVADKSYSSSDPKALIQDIYAHALPSLIRLLEATAAYHGSDGQLSGSDLRLLIRLTHLICTLGTKARGAASKDQPLNLGLVRLTITGILVPLGKVHTAFTAAYEEEKEAQRAAEAAVVARREGKERKRREEVERKAKEERERMRAKWQQLHYARMVLEPDVERKMRLRWVPMPRAPPPTTTTTTTTTRSRTRRRVAQSRREPDVDANGEPFSRLQVFTQRTNEPVPLPSPLDYDTEDDEEDEWTNTELAALYAGLELYAGPNVFEDTFSACCVPGAPLRRFSVLQITRKAKCLKLIMMRVDAAKGREMEAWVVGIPIFEV